MGWVWLSCQLAVCIRNTTYAPATDDDFDIIQWCRWLTLIICYYVCMYVWDSWWLSVGMDLLGFERTEQRICWSGRNWRPWGVCDETGDTESDDEMSYYSRQERSRSWNVPDVLLASGARRRTESEYIAAVCYLNTSEYGLMFRLVITIHSDFYDPAKFNFMKIKCTQYTVTMDQREHGRKNWGGGYEELEDARKMRFCCSEWRQWPEVTEEDSDDSRG